jgi:hypothetical protein
VTPPAAAPIPARLREAYLQRVAALLLDRHTPSPAEVKRACGQAMQIGAAEKKRLIAAIKRRNPSDRLALSGLVQRSQLSARHRQFAQAFTQLMEKAGVDVYKLNEAIPRQQRERPPLVEKRSPIDKKTAATALRAFRYGIEERRRSAKLLAALDTQPVSIFLDTPFFIYAANTGPIFLRIYLQTLE